MSARRKGTWEGRRRRGSGAGSSPQDPLTRRWMLREAVRCGLLLGAQGVCLQPALKPPTSLPNPIEISSTLDRLHKLEGYLRLKERSIKRNSQPDLAIDGLLREIKQEDLAALVEYMVGLDSSGAPHAMANEGALFEDTAHMMHESLTLGWKVLSFVPMKPQRFRRAEIRNPV